MERRSLPFMQRSNALTCVQRHRRPRARRQSSVRKRMSGNGNCTLNVSANLAEHSPCVSNQSVARGMGVRNKEDLGSLRRPSLTEIKDLGIVQGGLSMRPSPHLCREISVKLIERPDLTVNEVWAKVVKRVRRQTKFLKTASDFRKFATLRYSQLVRLGGGSQALACRIRRP